MTEILAQGKPKNFRQLLQISAQLFLRHQISFLQTTLIFSLPIFFVDAILWNNDKAMEKIFTPARLKYYFWIDGLWVVFLVLSLLLYLMVIFKIIKNLSTAPQNVKILDIYQKSLLDFKDYLLVKGYYIGKVFLWSLALLVPGLVSLILYSFSGLAFIVDGKKGVEALQFSKNIIKPNIIKYLDYLLFIILILSLLGVPVILLMDTLMDVSLLKDYDALAQIIDDAEKVIILMGTVFACVFFYHLYEEMKERAFLPGQERR